MELHITAQPHWILEAVELMYAYVNQIPPGDLTAPDSLCLSAEAVQEMMETACGHVSCEDPVVLLYFEKCTLSGEPEKATCIARNIVYNVISVSETSVDEDWARIRENRQMQMESGAQFSCIGEYRLDTVDFAEGEFPSLEEALARVNVYDAYRRKLLEVFSDFDGAVTRLQELLTPVVAKLEPLLEPWVRQAEPMAEQWRIHFREPGALEKLMSRANLREEMGVRGLRLQLRYLLPRGGQGMLHTSDLTVHMHMGLAVEIQPQEDESFTPSEFKALRLMGNEDCMRMLRAMLDQPMSSRELSRLLEIPLGTVCRNVSSLYNCKLLIIEAVDGWKRYRTNRQTMALLCRHIMELEKFKLF